MQNKKWSYTLSKNLILALGIMGLITCLSPYLIPKPFYSTITQFLYGKPYVNEGLTALRTMPTHEHLHRILGAVFALSGMLQFNDRFRKKYPSLHRRIGYLFILCSTIVAISGIILGAAIPFAGLTESILVVLSGSYLVYGTFKALYLAYKKKFILHQNWMTRAYSFALGVMSMRIFFFVINQVITIDNHLLFNITLTIGLLLNIGLAELWIAGKSHKLTISKQSTSKQKLAS